MYGQTRIVRFLLIECDCDTAQTFYGCDEHWGPVYSPKVQKLINELPQPLWHDDYEALAKYEWYEEPIDFVRPW